MARINLLDWREEERQQKQKEFIITLVLMAVLSLLIAWFIYKAMDSKIEYQQERNQYLETEIKQLVLQINEIDKIEAKLAELENQMEVIQNLQRIRPEAVRLFDEVVRVVPEGIHLQSFERKQEKSLTFIGRGETNPRISEFMRKMNASDRLETKDLREIDKVRKGIPAQIFTLDASQIIPGQKTTATSEGGR